MYCFDGKGEKDTCSVKIENINEALIDFSISTSIICGNYLLEKKVLNFYLLLSNCVKKVMSKCGDSELSFNLDYSKEALVDILID